MLAGAIVLCGLVLPNQFRLLTPAWFVRVPVEALLGAAVVLVLPRRPRRIVAALGGIALGLLVIVKVVDMFFIALFLRSADPVLDWTLLRNGWDFVTESYGRAGGVAAVAAVALIVGSVLAVTVWAALRMTRLVAHHRRTAGRTVLVLTVAWAVLAVSHVEIVPGEPVAAKSAAGFTYYRALQAKKSLQDREIFRRQAATDAFAGVPGLLTGLRGKDVVFAFVESYGYTAVTDPRYQADIGSVLDEGRNRLGAAGYASRSGFLTSPTAGGGSWFAHATFLSGLWIDNQQRYKTLVSSKRLTLGSAFRQGNWDTVGVMPGIIRSWPEGEFFGYDRVYGRDGLDYRGPRFGYAAVPDQYTLSTFHRQEFAKPGRGPLMAEIELMSSHTPWVTPPSLLDWDKVGDGSGFAPASSSGGGSLIGDTAQARAAYAKTIGYSLNTLISYVETHGDDDLVLVFLGDHQPTGNVTDNSGNFDVPITIVARDRTVLDRTAAWGWQDGLRPTPGAPVWKMSDFRDRFLTAFS